MDHHRGRGHAQPRRHGLGHARQRRDVSTAPRWRHAVGSCAADRLDGRRAARRGSDGGRLCFTPRHGDNRRRRRSLDPAKVAGKIVLCDRGISARVNKSQAVQEAGGVGMILLNHRRANSLNADFHFVPTVHLSNTDACRRSRPMRRRPVRPRRSTTVDDHLHAPAPLTAAFSSRGPLRAGGGDLLKPDVIAPGPGHPGGVAPPAVRQAGLQPDQRHVDVEPARGRARGAADGSSPELDADDDQVGADDHGDRRRSTASANTNPLVIFPQGAGHVRPNSAADPGLVFDHGFNDWLAFLCGTTTAVDPATCSALRARASRSIRATSTSPSIAIGDLAGIADGAAHR